LKTPRKSTNNPKSNTLIDLVINSKLSTYEKNLVLNYPIESINIDFVYALINNDFPIEYLVKRSIINNTEILVSPDVLLPRSESLGLVDLASNDHCKQGIFFDIGTGSGYLSIFIAKRNKNNTIYASDINLKALLIAQSNIINLGLQNQVILKPGSLLHPFRRIIEKKKVPKHFILNLPYIDPKNVEEIGISTYKHEPHSALFTVGSVRIYEKLFDQITMFNIRNYKLYMEINPQSIKKIKSIIAQNLPNTKISSHHDIYNHNRFLTVTDKYFCM